MAPDDILRSYEANRSVCARNWTLFTTLLHVIQRIRQMVRGDVRFMNEWFFWSGSFWLTSWIVWNSLWLEQHRSTSYSIYTHFQTSDSHSDWKWAKIWKTDSVLQFLQQSLNWGNSLTRPQDRFIKFIRFRHLKHPRFNCVYITSLCNYKQTTELNQFIETNCSKEPVHRKESYFLVAWFSGLQVIML